MDGANGEDVEEGEISVMVEGGEDGAGGEDNEDGEHCN